VSKPFVDSNVVLYLLSGDAAKADRAQAVLEAGAVISVQVLNEVVSVCMRKLKMPWPEIDALLSAVKAACDVVSLTVESHEQAILLTKRFQLSFYDAHIVACALLSGARVLLSEDMQSGMGMDGLLVQNPFASKRELKAF
jgi:predicted nucleic acid-binding protein